MGFLRRLFGSSTDTDDGGSASDSADSTDQYPDDRSRVTAWIRLSDPDFANEREQQRVFELENRVIAAVDASGAGTFDTNDLIRGYLGIQLLGEDADTMVEAVRPLLADAPHGSYLAVRRGPSGASEERLEIADD